MVSSPTFFIFSAFTFSSFSKNAPYWNSTKWTNIIVNNVGTHHGILDVIDHVHHLVNLSLHQAGAASKAALAGEISGDGHGLTDGVSINLEERHLPVW